MKKTVVILLLFVAVDLRAQEFSIKRVELSGNSVNLYYDLIDSVKSRTYTIELYSSQDNFISKLDKVAGDVGLEVKPGGNHKIVWKAMEELGSTFDGKISLEVRGRLYIPFVRLEGLNKFYKRGKDFSIVWRGGTQQNILNFDLCEGDEVRHTIMNIANVGQTTINIPTSVKPGKDYYFKITDSKNKDQVVSSQHFGIKRKIPLVLKVVPILAVGAAAATLGGSKGDNTIPDPKGPTTIH